MYRIDIYISKKDGKYKRQKNVWMNIPTFDEADRLTEQKNKDLGLETNMFVTPGRRFAMFDNQ